MPRPIQFETVLTRHRMVEELEEIEREITEVIGRRTLSITHAASARLRELRLAITRLPMDIDPQ